jgi:preprotein translocase subunit SecD
MVSYWPRWWQATGRRSPLTVGTLRLSWPFCSARSAIARRPQHFAIALDGQLLTVPFVDFKQYPDGINGDHGADISGDLTPRSARDLAILLRFGPLPADFSTAG